MASLTAALTSFHPSLADSTTIPSPGFVSREHGDLLAYAILQPPPNGVVPLKKEDLNRLALFLAFDSRRLVLAS